VNEEIDRQVDLMRSDSNRQRLDRIVEERRFGDYDILDELGRGGMGVVYKAFHRNLKRMVALKIILPENIESDIATLKRFKREAELHARLSHPNIVHVYDSGEIDGIHFFAMDFVTGTQLSKMIGSPEFKLHHRVAIVRQVAGALHHAHGHGVIHRDIKPDNIIVDAGWKANLVDFGIAKPTDMDGQENITRQGLAVGTPHYMAPEQFRPTLGEVGAHTDVYSLGAVLYHTLVGRPPFEADTAHGVLIKAATQTATSISGEKTPSYEIVSTDLAAIVAKCMRKNLDERYINAKAFSEDLERFLHGQEVAANPLSEADRIKRRLYRHWRAFGLWGVSSFILAAILTASLSIIDMVKSTSVTQNVATPVYVMSWIAAGGALCLLAASGALLIYRLRWAHAEDAVAQQVRPDEIGVTADEV
jgi:serine/threonine protein kinase